MLTFAEARALEDSCDKPIPDLSMLAAGLTLLAKYEPESGFMFYHDIVYLAWPEGGMEDQDVRQMLACGFSLNDDEGIEGWGVQS